MVVVTINLHVLHLWWLNPEYLLWGQGVTWGEMLIYLQKVMLSILFGMFSSMKQFTFPIKMSFLNPVPLP